MGLDTVEILLAWEQSCGITIEDSEAAALRTPRQAIELIAVKLGAQENAGTACLSMRAFHRLRDAIAKTARVSRSDIRPDSHVRDFLAPPRSRRWDEVRMASGIPSLPEPGWFAPHTMSSLVSWVITHAAKELKPAAEPWTRGEIRCVVREGVAEVTGQRRFGDDDDFIYDLGIS